jgi:osomolarity two-component system sensor histidine kinase TcsA
MSLELQTSIVSSQPMLTRDYPVGGAIGFHPNPKDQGSVFWFTSRLRKIDMSKKVDRLSAKFEATAMTPVLDSLALVRELAPGKRLLLAEDNFINQKVML